MNKPEKEEQSYAGTDPDHVLPWFAAEHNNRRKPGSWLYLSTLCFGYLFVNSWVLTMHGLPAVVAHDGVE
jgi:hypothetical protein